MRAIRVDGHTLTLAQVAEVAATTAVKIAIHPTGRDNMAAARGVVRQALEQKKPVYGLTTGLGARVGEVLSSRQLTEFSYRTIRGRAHAIGPPLPLGQVRAAMLVRLNGLMLGASCASPAVADSLLDCLNRGLTPVVGEIGSIGAGDLCLGATMALALIAEGQMYDPQGAIVPAHRALQQAGLQPLALQPGDGLALINHSAFTVATAALSVQAAGRLLAAINAAGAMSMEAFRANLSVLADDLAALHPNPHQLRVAAELNRLLQGSLLYQPGRARRLQDPLSIRNIVQTHGAVWSAIDYAADLLKIEINASSDNPQVVLERREIRSSGAYHTPHITLCCETVARALVQSATMQLARLARLLSDRVSGLPLFLAAANSNGFAPLMKIAESLAAEIHHAAAPVALWPSVSADGVEDSLTQAPLAARSLARVVDLSLRLCAVEFIVASQALELALPGNQARQMAAGIRGLLEQVRAQAPRLEQERPLTADLDRVKAWLEKASWPSGG